MNKLLSLNGEEKGTLLAAVLASITRWDSRRLELHKQVAQCETEIINISGELESLRQLRAKLLSPDIAIVP